MRGPPLLQTQKQLRLVGQKVVTSMVSILERVNGSSIMQKAVRSSALTIINFGSTQFIRLASNLILTRLLFPEAFGIMALATVLLTALNQFSDIGIIPSIIRSKRGEEMVFLNTAWTLKIIRSIVLWCVAWGLAWPMSAFYNEPLLAQVIPLMAITLLLDGLLPTKIESSYRHLKMGRLTALEIFSSLVGVTSMVIMAWILGTIWALPIGTVIGSAFRLVIFHFMLPGEKNWFALEKDAAFELINFGKWMFPATIATFVIIEADKFLIGRYVSLEVLGIYNIGFFLASFPLMMSRVLGGRVMVSFYRNSANDSSENTTKKARKLLFTLFGGLAASVILLVLTGTWLVDFLYDDRYISAGIILVALTTMHILQIAQIPYQNAVLGTGAGRDYFILLLIKAIFVCGSIWVGLEYYGLLGAILGQGVAMVLSYPFVVYFARKVKAYDPLFDLFMLAIAVAAGALAWWLYSDQITGLIV